MGRRPIRIPTAAPPCTPETIPMCKTTYTHTKTTLDANATIQPETAPPTNALDHLSITSLNCESRPHPSNSGLLSAIICSY